MYYGWILLAIIGCIYMICVGAAFYGLSVIMPAMIDDLGWTRVETTTGFAILAVVVGITGPPITALMKTLGPRLTIIIGGFVSAGASAVLYRYHSLPVYYCAAAVLGCGLTMQAVLPGTQLVTQWFHQRRSLALGLFMAAGGLGGVVGAPLFTWLIAYFGDWRPVWLCIAFTALFASLLSWLLVRNYPQDLGLRIDGVHAGAASTNRANNKTSKVYKTTRSWTVKEAFRDRNYQIILISGALAVTGHMIVGSQLVLHVQDMGMTAVIAASALGVQGIFTTSGRFLSGLLGDFTIEPRTLFLCGMISELLGTLLLINASQPFLLYSSLTLFGLGFGLGLVGSTTMMANYYGASNTPTLLSYRILLGTLLGGIGVVLTGYGGDIYGGYTEVFSLYASLLFIATLLILFIKVPEKT